MPEKPNFVITKELIIDTINNLPEILRPLFDDMGHLDFEQQYMFVKLIDMNQDVFAISENDIGLTNLVEHTIDVGDSKPIKQRAKRIPLGRRKPP